MGRTGKATTTTIKVQPDRDTKECVSDDTISKLMKDFTCASLLTNTTQSALKDQKSSVKEAHAECCEEIVSSLKHFHLKTPVNKRSRLKERKNLQRRSRTVLGNKYNLSVAAIHSQTSVVWPGKLNCLSNKRTDSSSDALIRPSRLSIPGIADKPMCSSSLSSPIQTSSSEEKARIAATLSSKNLSSFGDLKSNEKNGGTSLSFSKLCNRNSKDTGRVLSFRPLPTSIKTQCYRNSQTALEHSNSIDHNQSCSSSDFMRFCPETPKENNTLPSSSQQQQQQRTIPQHTSSQLLSRLVDADVMNNNISNTAGYPPSSPISQSSQLNSTGACSFTPERSCSEEMRMEESNVNELASYFEDLLHIPRKMSVMAEMMYA